MRPLGTTKHGILVLTVDIHGRTSLLYQVYFIGQDYAGDAQVKTDELEHLLHKILEKISNPDGNVELAKAYVKKDLALRQRQSENQKENIRESYFLDLP